MPLGGKYVRVDKWPNHAQPSGSGPLSGGGRERAADPSESLIPADSLGTEPESGRPAGAAPQTGGRDAWSDSAGPTAAWPKTGPDGAQGHPREVGEGLDQRPAAGSWFDNGHFTDPDAAAETQMLPGPGPVADPWTTADPAAADTRMPPGSAAAETQMLPGPALAAETQVLPGTPNASVPGTSAGADTDPIDPAGGGPAGTGPLRVQVEDPWENHDPHEVTVQLDAVSLRPGGTLGSAGPVAKEADRPVFVDESGRRSRRFRRLGIAIGLACAVYAVVIVVTLLSGNAAAPWVPLPAPGSDEQPSSKVKESPQQSDATSPSPDASGLPDASVDPSAIVDPSAGVNPPAGSTVGPGAPAAPGSAPAASTKPQPSASSTKKDTPGSSTPPATGGGGSSPDPGPSSTDPGSTDPGQDTDPPSPDNPTNAGGAPKADPVATTDLAADQPGAASDNSPENVL